MKKLSKNQQKLEQRKARIKARAEKRIKKERLEKTKKKMRRKQSLIERRKQYVIDFYNRKKEERKRDLLKSLIEASQPTTHNIKSIPKQTRSEYIGSHQCRFCGRASVAGMDFCHSCSQ